MKLNFKSAYLFTSVLLLILPLMALYQMATTWLWDFLIVIGCFLLASLVSFGLMVFDKRRAEIAGWRIPETVLHFFEAAGGWPGSFLAQRMVRHKTIKKRYQFFFWLIVAFYQVLCLEFLCRWRGIKTFINLLVA